MAGWPRIPPTTPPSKVEWAPEVPDYIREIWVFVGPPTFDELLIQCQVCELLWHLDASFLQVGKHALDEWFETRLHGNPHRKS